MLNTAPLIAPLIAPSPVFFRAGPSFAHATVASAAVVPRPGAGRTGHAVDMLALLNDKLSTQRRVARGAYR